MIGAFQRDGGRSCAGDGISYYADALIHDYISFAHDIEDELLRVPSLQNDIPHTRC